MNRTKGEEAIAMAMFWGRTNHQSFKPKKQLKNVTPTKEEAEKSLAYLDKTIKKLEEIL